MNIKVQISTQYASKTGLNRENKDTYILIHRHDKHLIITLII